MSARSLLGACALATAALAAQAQDLAGGSDVGNAAPEAPAPAEHPANPKDPWEGWNRGVHGFNTAVDDAVLKPVATAYRDVVPAPVRASVGNFFGNFSDLWSAVNQLLQGKLQYGLEMGMRVAVNSVFGIGGLFDPATEAGLERRAEDLGQTLGVWGFPSGPYIIWPFLGPSTVRDSFGLLGDRGWSGTLLFEPGTDRWVALGIQLVDTRANLLRASEMLDQIALDKYSFLRDAYLARRRSQVYDGDPPEEPEPPEADVPASAPAEPEKR